MEIYIYIVQKKKSIKKKGKLVQIQTPKKSRKNSSKTNSRKIIQKHILLLKNVGRCAMEEAWTSKPTHLQKKMQGQNTYLESQRTPTKHNKGVSTSNNRT